MPEFRGVIYIGLSVQDARASADWYRALFGFETVTDHAADGDENRGVLLVDAKTKFMLGLLAHRANPGEPFSEFHTGLDHLEFGVESRAELKEWVARLDALGIPHSGIKQAGLGALVTFRDPDNIQLELFFPSY